MRDSEKAIHAIHAELSKHYGLACEGTLPIHGCDNSDIDSAKIYNKIKVVEPSADKYRIRTKVGGTTDICERAKSYNGGGHAQKEGRDYSMVAAFKVSDNLLKTYPNQNRSKFDNIIRKEYLSKNKEFTDLFQAAGDETYESKELYSKEEIPEVIEKLNRIYNEIVTGDPELYLRTNSTSLYEHQEIIVEGISNVWKTSDTCLCYSAPRTGKSVVSLFVSLLRDFRTIIILTSKPKASESFRKEVENTLELKSKSKTIDMRGLKFFDSESIGNWDGNPENCVFLVSYQWARYYNAKKEKGSESYKHFKETLDSYFKENPGKQAALILDEIHDTSDTETSEAIINSFPYCNKKLYMSGTPFNDLFRNRFSKDVVVSYTLIDALRDYHNKVKNSVKFPHMRIEQMKEVNKAIKEAMKKDEFLDSIIDDFDGNALDNLKLAFLSYDRTYAFWKSLLYKASWLSKKKNRNIFAYVPDDFSYIDSNGKKQEATPAKWSVEALEALQEKYESYPNVFPLCDYNVIPSFDGKNAEEADINKFFDKEDTCNIVICKKAHTTGETFPRLDTILVLKKISSAELFWQLGCRPMSWYEGKEDTDVYIYLFDKDMALSMTGALVSSSSYGNKSEEDVINLIRELDLITISIEGFDFDKLSVTDILQAIHKVTDRELMSMASSCNKELSSFLDNLDEDSLNKLALCGKKKKASERAYTSADKEPSPFSKGDGNEDNGEDLSSKKKSNKDKGKGKDTTDGKEDNTETLRDKARRTVALFLEKFPSEVFVSDLTGDSNVKVEIANAEFYTKDIRKEFGEEVFDIFMRFIKDKDNLDIFSKKACEVIDKRDSLDKFDRYDFLVKSCNF